MKSQDERLSGSAAATTAAALGGATGVLILLGWSWLRRTGSTPPSFLDTCLVAFIVSVLGGAMAGGFGRWPAAFSALITVGVCAGWRLEPADAGSAVLPANASGALWVIPLAFLVGLWLGYPRVFSARKDASLPDEDRKGELDPSRTWVVIPTYNEAGNIASLVQSVRDCAPRARILVVDDDSPDGTAEIVNQRAAADPQVSLLVRRGVRGLDGAWLAGFQTALDAGAEVVVTMDGDGSHAAADLPRLLSRMGWADVVIGSRYIPGGKVVGWPLHRYLLSAGANGYARWVLDLPLRDCSSGFRAYSAPALARIVQGIPDGCGYSLLEVLLLRAREEGLHMEEVAITFRERRLGQSKMRLREAWNGVRVLWRLRRLARAMSGGASGLSPRHPADLSARSNSRVAP